MTNDSQLWSQAVTWSGLIFTALCLVFTITMYVLTMKNLRQVEEDWRHIDAHRMKWDKYWEDQDERAKREQPKGK